MYVNETTIDYFIIKGISDIPELQCLSFILVLLIYLFTLAGNMTIVLLVCLDHRLHTPMYYFLANLSILDMSSSTITLHNVLINFISGDNSISVFACLTQMYLFASLTCNELFILTVMSYDRYAAICNPFNYHVVMSHRTCTFLIIFCWLWGFMQVFPVLVSFSFFNCYRTREINHFFCDPVILENLLCNYSYFVRISIHLGGVFDATFPPFFTFLPYIFIIVTILRMRSSTSRRKTFYTCSSHLTVVILLYVTLICQYLSPTSVTNLDTNKLLSLFNTAVVPMLNPLIYSLKNKDVKTILKHKINDLPRHFCVL